MLTTQSNNITEEGRLYMQSIFWTPSVMAGKSSVMQLDNSNNPLWSRGYRSGLNLTPAVSAASAFESHQVYVDDDAMDDNQFNQFLGTLLEGQPDEPTSLSLSSSFGQTAPLQRSDDFTDFVSK
jgi:hypothetical protein